MHNTTVRTEVGAAGIAPPADKAGKGYRVKVTDIILQYMKDNKITYRKLASLTGTSAQNVWNILYGRKGYNRDGEKGTREPGYKSIIKICDALGIKVSIVPTGEAHDPDAIMRAAEMTDISFAAVESILEASGYTLQIEFPQRKGRGKKP